MSGAPDHLTRAQAAEWFASRGLASLTVRQLERLAIQRSGPPYSRIGRHVYYRPTELEAWLEETWKTNRGGGKAAA